LELYDEEIERARLYELFSSLFMKEPSEEVIMQLKEMFRMKSDDTPGEIARDFSNLFLRPDFHLSPHESLYNYPMGETPRLWGKATGEVQAFYRSAGLMIDEEADLIPDHVGLELLFMSFLAGNNLMEKQRAFMEKHLLRWVPNYCDEVEKHAGTTFYREIAVLVKDFLISDFEQQIGGS
jgi:TorA maturation chaperone TorD